MKYEIIENLEMSLPKTIDLFINTEEYLTVDVLDSVDYGIFWQSDNERSITVNAHNLAIYNSYLLDVLLVIGPSGQIYLAQYSIIGNYWVLGSISYNGYMTNVYQNELFKQELENENLTH